ncbi:MAG: hypothetical protein H6Q04_3140, partial [Acidobacteria bacterium]|nr:hypothetical protein [Acidobacteriota bacterium]
MSSHPRRTFVFCCLILAFAAPAFPQQTGGSILGVIKDMSGAVLPGVVVV